MGDHSLVDFFESYASRAEVKMNELPKERNLYIWQVAVLANAFHYKLPFGTKDLYASRQNIRAFLGFLRGECGIDLGPGMPLLLKDDEYSLNELPHLHSEPVFRGSILFARVHYAESKIVLPRLRFNLFLYLYRLSKLHANLIPDYRWAEKEKFRYEKISPLMRGREPPLYFISPSAMLQLHEQWRKNERPKLLQPMKVVLPNLDEYDCLHNVLHCTCRRKRCRACRMFVKICCTQEHETQACMARPVSCAYGCAGTFPPDSPHFTKRDGCPIRAALRHLTEDSVACHFCEQAHAKEREKRCRGENSVTRREEARRCSKLKAPISNFRTKVAHVPYEVHRYRKAAVYETLEETFGWLLFHRERLINFVCIMQHAHFCAGKLGPGEFSIACLPRDVFREIFVYLILLVDMQLGADEWGEMRRQPRFDKRQYFIGYEPMRELSSRTILSNVVSPPHELYQFALNHHCPNIHACPVPECGAYFDSPNLLHQHLRSSCARFQFPCLLCGRLLTRAEQETHGQWCEYKCIGLNFRRPGSISNLDSEVASIKICDALEAGAEDSLVNGTQWKRLACIDGKGKSKCDSTGPTELICFSFGGLFDAELHSLTKVKGGYYRRFIRSPPYDELLRRNAVKFEAFSPLAKEVYGL